MRSAAEKPSKRWNMRRFLLCLLAGGVVALVFGLLRGGDALSLRIGDALFMGGLAILLFGVCLAIGNLGFFDLPAYCFRKLRQTLRRAREGADDETPREERLTSYAEYLTRPKPLHSCKEALAAGVTLIVLSTAVLLLFWNA